MSETDKVINKKRYLQNWLYITHQTETDKTCGEESLFTILWCLSSAVLNRFTPLAYSFLSLCATTWNWKGFGGNWYNFVLNKEKYKNKTENLGKNKYPPFAYTMLLYLKLYIIPLILTSFNDAVSTVLLCDGWRVLVKTHQRNFFYIPFRKLQRYF